MNPTPASTPSGGPASKPPAPPRVPDHELLRRIGKGAYGEVWLARSVTGAFRAVKIVHRSSFDHDRPYEREFEGIRRFEPISRQHDSQVDILHVGRNGDCFYYVMELADDQATGGQINPDHYTPRTLKSDLVFRSRIPFEECVRIGVALTTALEHLHANGLVHRDVKPSNIIFVNGVAKLADIGLVTGVDATRSFVGTEGFAAPEGAGTAQADLFSLGKVLYEAATGKDRQEFPELPTLLNELPDREGLQELNAVITRACRHDPKDRYTSAAAMRAELELLQSGKSLARLHRTEARLRFVQRAGIVVTVLAAVIAAGWLWQARQTHVVRKLAAENLTLAERSEASATLAEKNAQTARARLYAADIHLAHQALQANNLRLARSLLQSHLPQSGQPDLRGFEWRYLWHQCQTEELFSIQGPTNQVRVLAFAPDGHRIAVGGLDGITKVLDLQIRQEIASLPVTNRVHSLSFSPGGDLLAIGYPTRVSVLDAPSLTELRRLPSAAAPAVFSPDRKFLLTGKLLPAGDLESPWTVEQTLMVWDATDWSVIRSTSFPTSGPPSIARDLYLQVAFGADSSRMAVLAGDTIRVLQFPDLKEITKLSDKIPIKQYSRPFIALSPDNRTLAVPGQQGFEIRLWDIDGNRELHVLTGHTDMVIAAAFSPDGTMLATCSPDQTTRLWEVATGELLNTFRGQGDEVFDVAFSSHGKTLASLGCYDGVVKLWDPTRRPRREFFRDSLIPVGFEADGGLLAFRQPGQDAVVLDAATLRVTPVGIPELREGVLYRLYLNSVSSDGRFQAVWGRDQSGASEPFVEVWDRREAKRLCVLPAISPRVSFAPTRNLISTFTTNWHDEVLSSTIWQLPAGTRKWVFTNAVWWVAPDEEHLLTRAESGELCLWRIDGDAVKPALTIPGAFGDTVISPDGRLLATFEGGDIQIRSLPAAELVGVLKGHTRKGTRLAFSPDGRTLASICDDRTIRLWHIATQRELLQFQSPDEDRGPFFLEFSPDGRALAATRRDDKGPIAWLYFAPSLAEIAVVEGGDYRSAAGDNAATWLHVARELLRQNRPEEALEACVRSKTLAAVRDEVQWWLEPMLQPLRVEILRRVGHTDE